jgi:diguanylate cyclase (GGDEF)-like protein
MDVMRKHIKQPLWQTAGFILLFNGIFFAYLLFKPGSQDQLILIDDCTVAVGPLLMSLLCFFYGIIVFRQRRTALAPARTAVCWTPILLGMGLLSYSLGQGIWTYYEQALDQLPPVPSLADAGYLGVYPFMLMGILLISQRPLSAAMRTRIFLDGLMIMTGVVTFSWYFILGPTILQGNGTFLTKIVGAAYPFSDLVMVFCILFLWSHNNDAELRPAMRILSLALLIIVLTDSSYDYQLLQGTYTTGHLMNVGWTLGFMLVGLATQELCIYLTRRRQGSTDRVAPTQNSSEMVAEIPSFWRSLLPYALVPAVAALLIYTVHTERSGPLEHGVYIGGIVLVVLVLLRQIFAIHETVVYARQTQQLNEALRTAHHALEEKNAALHEANARLEALATTDLLTNLPNHRALVTALEREFVRAERHHSSCSLCFLDIDHFKALNDGYGHSAGDVVLHEFASVVQSVLRDIDIVGRWGGEEFVVIMPDTDREGAMAAAERVRAAVAEHMFSIGGGVRLSCSVGVACYPIDANERDSLVLSADRAMYAAKRLGRNQVCAANNPAVLALDMQNDQAGSREDATLIGTVEALSALVKARDNYTGQHTHQGGLLTLQLAMVLGLDTAEAYMVGLAGRLHDVGKIGIPDAILRKPTRLTEEEWNFMYMHPVIGADVVSRVPSLRAIAPIVRAHHERWDGTGYPDKLAGETIPLGARIIAVVDAYVTMTTDRPYQKARDSSRAFAELRRCAGTQFDPRVVEALESLLLANSRQAETAGVA